MAWFNKTDSNRDYVTYLDPTISHGDTEVGAFRNGESFFIYLPEAYKKHGNLTITPDIKVVFDEMIRLLSDDGLDISALDSLDYTQHEIKIDELVIED